MLKQEAYIQRVKNMVSNSNRIVVLLGIGTVIESGGENLWSSRACYRMEDKYHKTPDEMMSVGFYSARRDRFFEFYKAEILSQDLKPSSLYYDLKRLQDTGKVKKFITQNMDGLHFAAGLTNVLELHGNIHKNWCPRCGRSFCMEYVRDSQHVPHCDACGTPIRPGIRLFGENIENNLMTEAVNACEDSDLILALGTNMYDNMVKFCTKMRGEAKIVLITKEEHYLDKYADIVIHDNVFNVLPQIF